jgi:hypothetical protein
MDPDANNTIDLLAKLTATQYNLRSLFFITTIIALVFGLVAWHGVEILFVIIPNAAVALLSLAVGRDKRNAGAASLFALFSGWCVAFVSLVAWQVHFGGFGYLTDFEFWLFWPAIFALVGWLFFVLPAIGFVSLDSILYRPLFAVLSWASLAVVAYAVLVCTWAADAWYLARFPAIIGGVAGLIFPFLAKSRCPTYILAAGPSIVLICFWCFLWPSLEVICPGFTYTYGTENARNRSRLRVFQAIKNGDSMLELERRYPSIFPGSSSGVEGIDVSGGTERYEYRFQISIDQITGNVDHVSCELQDRR